MFSVYFPRVRLWRSSTKTTNAELKLFPRNHSQTELADEEVRRLFMQAYIRCKTQYDKKANASKVGEGTWLEVRRRKIRRSWLHPIARNRLPTKWSFLRIFAGKSVHRRKTEHNQITIYRYVKAEWTKHSGRNNIRSSPKKSLQMTKPYSIIGNRTPQWFLNVAFSTPDQLNFFWKMILCEIIPIKVNLKFFRKRGSAVLLVDRILTLTITLVFLQPGADWENFHSAEN